MTQKQNGLLYLAHLAGEKVPKCFAPHMLKSFNNITYHRALHMEASPTMLIHRTTRGKLTTASDVIVHHARIIIEYVTHHAKGKSPDQFRMHRASRATITEYVAHLERKIQKLPRRIQ